MKLIGVPGTSRTAAWVSVKHRANVASVAASRPGHASGQITPAAVCHAPAPSAAARSRSGRHAPPHVAPPAARHSQAYSATSAAA